jgi:radical S-adenosyl methionine domain-containing protein 2
VLELLSTGGGSTHAASGFIGMQRVRRKHTVNVTRFNRVAIDESQVQRRHICVWLTPHRSIVSYRHFCSHPVDNPRKHPLAMFFNPTLLFFAIAGLLLAYFVQTVRQRRYRYRAPISVNYHFTRKCNYKCGFCFHTAKTSDVASLAEAKQGLAMLKDAGMKKLNFAGGEPFLYPKWLGEMLRFCKEELDLDSVSIVTNGSHVTKKFLRDYGKYIDILAVSCDSFVEDTNRQIGRGNGAHIQKTKETAQLCREFGIMFKINTVVNRFNFQEDMNEGIQRLNPFRWKCFQVLVVEGENSSQSTLRDARSFVISDLEFKEFCDKHSHNSCFVPEPNNLMKSSYLILDEYLRFFDKDANHTSKPILDVGVHAALAEVVWDEQSFVARGGIYDWSKSTAVSDSCSAADLDW